MDEQRKASLIEFFSRGRIIGAALTFSCLIVSVVAKFQWNDIDLTQIIMMILSSALTLLAAGAGASNERARIENGNTPNPPNKPNPPDPPQGGAAP